MNKRSATKTGYLEVSNIKAKVLDKETIPVLRALASGKAKNDYHYKTTIKFADGTIATSYSKILYFTAKKGQEIIATVYFLKLPNGKTVIHV